MMPKPDYKKTRRRIEDHLRKNPGVILKVAKMLNIPIAYQKEEGKK
jgi:hypothetical protein